MSKKPENVKCGNCCYWQTEEGADRTIGRCHIRSIQYFPARQSDNWCGEFDDTWPDKGVKRLVDERIDRITRLIAMQQ